MEAPVTSRSPRVLAVVVTYNAMQWADRCFGSLLASKATLVGGVILILIGLKLALF